MHEFYERSRPKWWQRIRVPSWKPLLAIVVVIATAIAGYFINSGSLIYEGFELHGGPVVTDLGTNPTVVMLTSHRETRRVTTGRYAMRANNYSDLHWDLFAFNAKDLSQKWITRLVSIRRGSRQMEATILGASHNTVWVLADELMGVSLSDGEVIGTAESIAALNPQLRGIMPTSRKQMYFDNGLMLVTADGRYWRIDNESLRAFPVEQTMAIKTSILGVPVSMATDSMNVLPVALSTQYQAFKKRDYVVGDTWYGLMHPSEVELQRRDPHTQNFNGAVRYRLWSSPLRDTVDRFRNPARLPLDFAPLDASPEFLRGGLLTMPDAAGRDRVVGIANPTRLLVVHQDRIDQAAQQTLSCIDLQGRVCWNAPLEMYVASSFSMLTRGSADDWALIVTGFAKPRPGDRMGSEGDDMPMLARVSMADGRTVRFRFADVDFAALDDVLRPYRNR